MKQQYRLFYRDTEIGDIIQEDADFPSMFGTFRPAAESHGDAIRGRMQQYIDYSVAADQLLQEGKEEEWERFCSENEPQFLDLIETDDWHLSEEGTVEPILIPNFCQNDGIVWRWNVNPGSAD